MNGDLRDLHLSHELDVYVVRVLPVGLPESFCLAVAQLVDTVTCLGRAQSPHGLVANLTPFRVTLRRIDVAGAAHADWPTNRLVDAALMHLTLIHLTVG